MDQQKRTCAKCSRPLDYSGNGRPPKFCPEHDPKPARTKKRAVAQLIRLRDRTKETEATRTLDEFREHESERAEVASAWHSRLLAAALGLESDPNRAAALVGLTLTGAELDELVVEARRHRDLSDRRPTAVGALLATAISTGAIRFAAKIHEVPTAQLGTAIRSIAQSLELVQGQAAPTFTDIAIHIHDPSSSVTGAELVADIKEGFDALKAQRAAAPAELDDDDA